MPDALLYGELGLRHILDPSGLDHVLFLAALCAVYALDDWRRVLWLATAFTVGHSVTLALAVLGAFRLPEVAVEVLIPATILAAGAVNLRAVWRGPAEAEESGRPWPLYALTVGFGLVHGLGFSGYLRALLGGRGAVALPLLAFNVGLEVVGQVVVVAATLALGTALVRVALLPRPAWTLCSLRRRRRRRPRLLADRWPL